MCRLLAGRQTTALRMSMVTRAGSGGASFVPSFVGRAAFHRTKPPSRRCFNTGGGVEMIFLFQTRGSSCWESIGNCRGPILAETRLTVLEMRAARDSFAGQGRGRLPRCLNSCFNNF